MTALAVVVATGLVLNRLTGARDRSHETVEALALAKASLLAYAVAGSTTRPGELPCPDVDYDGLSTAGVDYTAGGDNPCVSLRGWLPHRTLGVESAILDSEDERLWFALADLYHSGHQDPLNSDVPGSLQVDAYTDIVAVVIAPLAPVDDAQDAYRPGESAAHDAVVDVGHYLEHANADATLTTYVSQVSSGDFNDRLIALTRAELMAAVEKRVLGEVAQVLETYRNESWNTATVYPWLAPLGDPSASAFEASVGTSVGYLSYHEPNDAFATSYLMDWDLNSATVNRWGTVKGWQLRDDTVSFSTTEGTCHLGDGGAGDLWGRQVIHEKMPRGKRHPGGPDLLVRLHWPDWHREHCPAGQ